MQRSLTPSVSINGAGGNARERNRNETASTVAPSCAARRAHGAYGVGKYTLRGLHPRLCARNSTQDLHRDSMYVRVSDKVGV